MNDAAPNSYRTGPDESGRFGDFGGRFVSETLMPLILDLEAEYEKAKTDPTFWAEMDDLWKHYVGRPSPLYFAERLTDHFGGAKVYLKRDELNHTGAHKINNVLGQILLARRMGKKRIIAETGAGQHGVATATVCARFGLQCVVFMGATDVERQKPNVFRMKLLGAEVKEGKGPAGKVPMLVMEAMEPGEVALLENLRFNKREERNDPGFARKLAGLADVFVNDAFGTAHRAHASTVGVAEHMPAVAGMLMARELEMLGACLENPDQPVVAVIGGAKVSDKIAVLTHLASKVDTVLVGGGGGGKAFVRRRHLRHVRQHRGCFCQLFQFNFESFQF